MNVVVCNLTRFGDLLQSQAVIDDLHCAGHNVDLVCLDNFAVAVPLLRHVRHAYPLDAAKLLANTDRAWPLALAQINAFVEQVKEQSAPDYVLNLTPSVPARLLAWLLAASGAKILGFGLDSQGFGADHGVWASFFAVAAGKRVNSPFNLVDMLRQMASPITNGMTGSFHLAQPDAASLAWADKLLSTRADGDFVAFQLGASEDRRRWPVASFRALGGELWRQRSITPVLLGSSAERHLGDKYALGADHPFIDAIGKTNIPQLAALLTKMRLLVTNDTGTMHLASGLNVPGLAFFLASAQPWDTGPMLPGYCCLEPALNCHPCAYGSQCELDNACRQTITPAMTARLCLRWFGTGQWQAADMQAARAWLTGADANNFYELRPLSNACAQGNGVWLAWLRIFWRQLFDDMENDRMAAASAIDEAFAGLPRPEDAAAIADTLRQGADILLAIADGGRAVRFSPRMGQIVLRNCERLQALLAKIPGVSGIAAFWRQFRLNQGGDMDRFCLQCGIMAAHWRILADALAASE